MNKTYFYSLCDNHNVPSHYMDGLYNYVHENIRPGSFLTAILENDLYKAMNTADLIGRRSVYEITTFLFQEVDTRLFGSRERVDEHIARRKI